MELIKLFLVFVIIMILLIRRLPIGPVMFMGTILLVILYRVDIGSFINMIWQATKAIPQ